ncbi:hypothetical protein MASR1M32_12190 [Rhodobacter sp.]
MCGKFTQMATWREVYDFYNLFAARKNDDEELTFTPMRAVPVVHLDADRRRIISPMVWGFTDRYPDGRRRPKHMHARGETVHQLPTFREAFRRRRGVTWIKTFNEGLEVPVMFTDDTPAGKTWTQQWRIRRSDDRPTIIGVIYDEFDVGRGLEREFVQVTVPANALISEITDRMPLLLEDEDLPNWLGEVDATEDQVRALIRTMAFDDRWTMSVEDPSKKPPRARKAKA